MKNIIKKRNCIFVLLFLCLLNIQNVLALENGLARTPSMGWNSWNHFGSNIDEMIIREIADAMVSSGMCDTLLNCGRPIMFQYLCMAVLYLGSWER